MEEALTVAAFSSVSHLFLEAPTDHEEKNEYEKTMGELVVSHSMNIIFLFTHFTHCHL